MKKYIMILFIAAVASMEMNAQISIRKDTIDCGVTLYADSVQAKFTMINNGIQPLQIMKIEVSCGCTKVGYPFLPIMPKKEFVITMTYDAMQLGHYAKWVDVYVEDYDKPLRLTMVGTIKSPRQPFQGRKRFMKNYDKF